MSATVTSDFRVEYETERLRRLRRRFLWYTGIFGGFGAVSTLGLAGATFFLPAEQHILWLAVVGLSAVSSLLFLGLFVRVRRAGAPISRRTLVRLAYWLIVVNGMIQFPARGIADRLSAERALTSQLVDDSAASGTPASEQEIAAGESPVDHEDHPDSMAEAASIPVVVPDTRRPTLQYGAGWLSSVFLSHLLASLFLPWTPREAIKPLVPLLIVFSAFTLVFVEGAFVWRLTLIAASPLIGMPGVMWSAWRTSRFRDRFHSQVFRRSYRELRRELVDARRIHEDLFPKFITDGAVRLVYRYEPMRQIGGDFLYVHRFPGVDGDPSHEPLSVVMIDVTGHGIPAAMTINRLFGELERLFGEEPDIPPGEVLTALNSYVHYTLAPHSVYATALCLRINHDLDLLEWASGGHPPAFLRTADGRIDRLDSTAFVLGACHGEDFDSNQRSAPFMPGDRLLAYTDGAIEARDETGRMLGLVGFQRMVASIRPESGGESGWISAILRAVEKHREGPPADDTLIVELRRVFRD